MHRTSRPRRPGRWSTRAVPATVAILCVTALTSTSASPAASRAAPTTTAASVVRGLAEGRPAWVNVSVATLWRTPDSPREVDRPALARPAGITAWLAGMSTAERRALNGRADTQALLGDRVRVLRLRPGWARVVVPSQPSQRDERGYPGWVPRRQLTSTRPTLSTYLATVTNRTAWLRLDRRPTDKVLQISFGTRLPVVGRTPRFVRVAMPGGSVRRIVRSTVIVHERTAAAVEAGRDSLVATARSFQGLSYLWAGASGFGLDCSGLTWLTYRVHGIRTPRDALPQSQSGTPVRRPRRGDLMFYATDGLVHHVSMYVGDGMMVHAPGTGQTVEVVPTSTSAYRSEYAGARRYLP